MPGTELTESPTPTEVAAYYASCLIAQYYNKPKAIATVEAYAGQLIADNIALNVRDGFDLEVAVGQQLDFLGKLRGISRYYFSLVLTKTYMALPSYDDPSPGSYLGLSTYDLPQPPAWHTMLYDDFIANTLLDGDFRRVIKFLAKIHSCDYSLQALDNIFFEFFFGNVNILDNVNMTMTYQHLTSDTDNLFEIVKQMGLLPRPAGVTVSTAEVPSF